MEYILDTDHWSCVLKDRQDVMDRLQAAGATDPVRMTVVSAGEILSGIEQLADSRRKRRMRTEFDQILGQVGGTLPISFDIARQYAEIHAALRRSGTPIPTNDIWITAAARVRDETLVTNDDHFRYVPGLRVERWVR